MQIAILQTAGRPADVDHNLDLLARAAAEVGANAGDDQARLLICPELFLSGYNIGAAITELAEPMGGPMLARAVQIAKREQLALLFGYPERAGDVIYNSACLIERDGQIVANYRKTHLYGDDENHWFQPGEQFVRATIDDFTVGLLICYDVEFPEAVRTQVLAGCDLIAVPTALMWPQDFAATQLVPARAIENGCFVAYVNHCGEENGLRYVGLSCVIAPDGSELARAGRGEALLRAELNRADYDDTRRLVPYLQDRRPALYQ